MTGTKVIKLKLEEGGRDSLPELKDSVLRRALKVYEAAPSSGFGLDSDDVQGVYDMMVQGTRGFNASPAQVEQVLTELEMAYSQDDAYPEKVGLLLTALVHDSFHREFKISLQKDRPLNFIGYKLGKGKKIIINGEVDDLAPHLDGGEVEVFGNGGNHAGYGMTDGKVHIHRGVGVCAGECMRGGTLIVDKNAGDWTGARMVGGDLIIKGNAGEYTCNGMEGGRVDIGGRIKNLSDEIKGGEVYHKGEKIWLKEGEAGAVSVFEWTRMPMETTGGFSPMECDSPWDYYKLVSEKTKRFDLNSNQVNSVMGTLEKRFSKQKGFAERLGLFLTALIENSSSKEFTLKPKTLLTDLGDNLKSDKTITVKGSVGGDIGFLMEKGRIHIKGDAGDEVGVALNGGHIIIDGNCGEGCGRRMKNGRIEVGGKIANKYHGSRGGGEVWEKGERVYP
ncbi:MAG: hypothetical protein V1921_06355 [Candidatus Altiarchaeota archaeon]